MLLKSGLRVIRKNQLMFRRKHSSIVGELGQLLISALRAFSNKPLYSE